MVLRGNQRNDNGDRNTVNNTTNDTKNGKGARRRGQDAPPAEIVGESKPLDPAQVVQIKPSDYLPKVVSIPITIRGITPLIVNNFNEKLKMQMLGKQMGQAQARKAPKDPQKNFEGSKYVDSKGRECLHSGGIRNAMIQAARNVDGVTMTSLKQAIFIEGPEGPAQTLLPITFSTCNMREDVVRNESGVADIRHRAEYTDWSCEFKLHVVQNVITVVQAMQLLSMAGFAVGLHEWRPAGKNGLGGPFGRFEIVTDDAQAAAE